MNSYNSVSAIVFIRKKLISHKSIKIFFRNMLSFSKLIHYIVQVRKKKCLIAHAKFFRLSLLPNSIIPWHYWRGWQAIQDTIRLKIFNNTPSKFSSGQFYFLYITKEEKKFANSARTYFPNLLNSSQIYMQFIVHHANSFKLCSNPTKN